MINYAALLSLRRYLPVNKRPKIPAKVKVPKGREDQAQTKNGKATACGGDTSSMRPLVLPEGFSKSTVKLRKNIVKLILSELEVGHTFAQVSLESSNPDTKRRNQENARKAYDTACRWLKGIRLADEERAKVARRLERIKSDLHELGEPF